MGHITEGTITLGTSDRSVAEHVSRAGRGFEPELVTVRHHPLTEATNATIVVELALGGGDTVLLPRHVRGGVHDFMDAMGRASSEAEVTWRLDGLMHKSDLIEKFARYILDPSKGADDPLASAPNPAGDVARLERNNAVLTDQVETLQRKNTQLEKKLEEARGEHLKLFDQWQDAIAARK